MKIKELQPNKTGSIERATVIDKGEIRTFSKFGKEGRVCSCILEDDSGTVTLSLWNEEVDTLSVGDVISLSEGWVKEWNNQLQISTGRSGKITKL